MLTILFKIIFTIVLVAALSPLTEGYMRKFKAAIHSRKGPPIFQPYLDIFKLLGKEELRVTDNILFRLAPLVCFGSVLTASLFVSFGYSPALTNSGDIIAFVYLITLSSVAVFIGGLASSNPYAGIGSSRELMMLFTVEPILVITLIIAGVKAKSLIMTQLPISGFSISMIISAIAFFLAIQALMCKLPFDIVEADQEIMEGPFIEYSGPQLALFKWSYYMKGFIFASVFCRIYLNWPNFHNYFMPDIIATCLNIVVNIIEVFIILTIIELIDVTNPRLRIDQSLRYFGMIIFMVMCGLAFAIIGS
ncbi:NADH-quinone oxidoreductase subunit H [bacterium]|nr:NADH-quinone oxidoreductase subunit H [bacterium]